MTVSDGKGDDTASDQELQGPPKAPVRRRPHNRVSRTPGRDLEALSLRRNGMVYDEIARRLGFGSHSAALYAVQRAMAKEKSESPEQIRANMTWLLDDQITRMRLLAMSRTPPLSPDEAVRVSQQLVALLDRKAKLHGVDAPVRRAIEVSVLSDQFLRDERQRLLQKLVDAGFDPDNLPTPDQVVERLVGQRPALGPGS